MPLSPNWRLAAGGVGVRLVPHLGSDTIARQTHLFVPDRPERRQSNQQEPWRVGDGICPYGDCGRVIDSDEIKRQARDGRMGEQLFAVAYRRCVRTTLKSGKPGRDQWAREYRAPRADDDNQAEIRARLEEKLPEWEALDMVPSERFPTNANDTRPIQHGMPLWRDLFSPRQLLCHGTSGRGVPRDAHVRPLHRTFEPGSRGCLRILGARVGYSLGLQQSRDGLGCYHSTSPALLFPT